MRKQSFSKPFTKKESAHLRVRISLRCLVFAPKSHTEKKMRGVQVDTFVIVGWDYRTQGKRKTTF